MTRKVPRPLTGIPTIFDRRLLAARKQRALATAPADGLPDFLLARVADDLADRLAIVRREFPTAVNLGAWNGVLSRRLRRLDTVGLMIDVDASPGLLASCDGPCVAADEEMLPFADGAIDLVVSGLSLQLVNDLPGALAQLRRCLKPDGLLLAAFLGGETLSELRQAWLAAEAEINGGASPRVAPFADVREAGALLQRAGFALPVADADVVRVRYATPLHLMRELKAMGVSNMLAERSRRPVSRRLLLRAAEIYGERFAAGGRVAATFEIITVTAWVPHESQQKPLRPGSATMRLADALGVAEGGSGPAERGPGRGAADHGASGQETPDHGRGHGPPDRTGRDEPDSTT